MILIHGRFINHGSLCYIISVLHALQYITRFKDYLNSRSDNVSKVLNYLFETVKNDTNKILNINILQRVLDDKRWSSNDQHDACEFLYSLLDKIDSKTAVFTGVLRYRYVCMACGHKSYNKEIFKIIDLHVKSVESNLCDLLDEHFLDKRLDSDNKYTCSLCSRMTTASIKINVTKAPSCLLICLKRYSSTFDKLTTLVTNPEYHSLEKYYLSYNSTILKYKLKSVILHYGHLSGGHYVTIVNIDSGWILYDDSSEIKYINNYITNNAYILLYILDDE
jgi:ubiquitin C-terminal hydrolase